MPDDEDVIRRHAPVAGDLVAGIVAGIVDHGESAGLRGFWNERNNTLGAVPEEHRAGVAARAKARLLRNQLSRREIVYTWPTWVFQAAALEC